MEEIVIFVIITIKILMLTTIIIMKSIIVIMMIMIIKITTSKGRFSLHNSLYMPCCLFWTSSKNSVAQTHIFDKINEYQYILKYAIWIYIPSQRFERNFDRAKVRVSLDKYCIFCLLCFGLVMQSMVYTKTDWKGSKINKTNWCYSVTTSLKLALKFIALWSDIF